VIGEVLQLIAELMQVEVTSVRDEARLRPATSEVERLYAGIAKANAALGWTPRYAGRDGFARGLEETIAWFCKPSNLARYHAERYAI